MKTALLESGKLKLDGKRIFFSLTRSQTDVKTKMGCWFCLDNPEADKSLVVFENPQFYLALDKRPVSDLHFLVVPLNHKKNFLALGDAEKSALSAIEGDLSDFYAAEKLAYIKYERYFKLSESVSHMLTHFIPVPLEKFSSLDLMFKSHVRDTMMEFFEVAPGEKLEGLLAEKDYYIHLSFANPQTKETQEKLCILSEALVSKLPFDFMRQFICSIIGRPDRIDPRKCERKPDATEFIGLRIKKFMVQRQVDRTLA